MKQFDKFTARALYCNLCKKAVAVTEKMISAQPECTVYDYQCNICGSSLGSKTEKSLDSGK
ncbi:MAG: hypothetical protein HQK88_13045 [Nitrospirae bacterium]|nr:hypothetical protein [Nitrospirota bacterium]MBF0520742.1 hypothetical protein [Nitrospirota bacterium]MBF0535806.1 hypothetical protein [Nitrospirota bacterium]MBF0617729.1 hypothetical protein [Nitrospirota bacterium]